MLCKIKKFFFGRYLGLQVGMSRYLPKTEEPGNYWPARLSAVQDNGVDLPENCAKTCREWGDWWQLTWLHYKLCPKWKAWWPSTMACRVAELGKSDDWYHLLVCGAGTGDTISLYTSLCLSLWDVFSASLLTEPATTKALATSSAWAQSTAPRNVGLDSCL